MKKTQKVIKQVKIVLLLQEHELKSVFSCEFLYSIYLFIYRLVLLTAYSTICWFFFIYLDQILKKIIFIPRVSYFNSSMAHNHRLSIIYNYLKYLKLYFYIFVTLHASIHTDAIDP